VRLLAGASLIDATVVKVGAANDLALLKDVGAFKPLPIAASRTVKLGSTVAPVGFPDIGLQGFAPKVLAHGHHGENRCWEVELRPGDDPQYFQISVPVLRGASCPNSQRTEERMAAGMILTRICLAVCCGLGQTAVRAAARQRLGLRQPPGAWVRAKQRVPVST
jgi:hypothetical protein